jgi:hypothetical protein
MKTGAAHKKKLEEWLQVALEAGGDGPNATRLARQVVLLLDGSFSLVLLHRDPAYIEAAGEAAGLLVRRGGKPRP